jgi:hypothetical protein
MGSVNCFFQHDEWVIAMLKWRMPCKISFHILVELKKGVEFYEILGMLKSMTWELIFHKKGPCAINCVC